MHPFFYKLHSALSPACDQCPVLQLRFISSKQNISPLLSPIFLQLIQFTLHIPPHSSDSEKNVSKLQGKPGQREMKCILTFCYLLKGSLWLDPPIPPTLTQPLVRRLEQSQARDFKHKD